MLRWRPTVSAAPGLDDRVPCVQWQGGGHAPAEKAFRDLKISVHPLTHDFMVAHDSGAASGAQGRLQAHPEADGFLTLRSTFCLVEGGNVDMKWTWCRVGRQAVQRIEVAISSVLIN